MKKWTPTPVPIPAIVEEGSYFICRLSPAGLRYAGTTNKGKGVMTLKPGMADVYVGNDKLRLTLFKHADHIAVEVPADASKRWRRWSSYS